MMCGCGRNQHCLKTEVGKSQVVLVVLQIQNASFTSYVFTKTNSVVWKITN